MQYHPKNNPDNADARRKFNEVNEAYNALSTESKRHNYDTFSFGQIAPLRAHNILKISGETDGMNGKMLMTSSDQLSGPDGAAIWTEC